MKQELTTTYIVCKAKVVILICGLILTSMTGMAQQLKSMSKNKGRHSNTKFTDALKKTPWTIGIGGNVIDDDGKPFKNLFNVSETWNFLPYPTRLTLDGYIKGGFSAQLEVSYNKYKIGKNINSEIIPGNWSVISSDVNFKYALNYQIKNMKWFDPYVLLGLGYTQRSGASKPNTCTYNMGLGFNIWIIDFMALNMQSAAKFSMIEGTSNYLQHSVGLIFATNWGVNGKNTIVGNRNKARSQLKTKY